MTQTQSLTLQEALVQYQVEYLASRNLAPRTRSEYLTDLEQLVEYLTARHVQDIRGVERRHLEGFLAELDGRGLAGSTRRRKVAAIRGFFDYLESAGHITQSPAKKLIPPEWERIQPRVLSEAEYKRLLDVVRHEPRDGAVIELLLQTGLRLSEVARLTIRDVEIPGKLVRPDPRKGEPGSVGNVRVLGKGRKGRTLTLNYKACKAIGNYLLIRGESEEPYLFLTKFGKGIGPRSIEYLVEKHLVEAGIHDASVHALRHTFATHHVRRGTKLEVVRQALGHESLATTQIYVTLAREVMDKELQEHAL